VISGAPLTFLIASAAIAFIAWKISSAWHKRENEGLKAENAALKAGATNLSADIARRDAEIKLLKQEAEGLAKALERNQEKLPASVKTPVVIAPIVYGGSEVQKALEKISAGPVKLPAFNEEHLRERGYMVGARLEDEKMAAYQRLIALGIAKLEKAGQETTLTSTSVGQGAAMAYKEWKKKSPPGS